MTSAELVSHTTEELVERIWRQVADLRATAITPGELCALLRLQRACVRGALDLEIATLERRPVDPDQVRPEQWATAIRLALNQLDRDSDDHNAEAVADDDDDAHSRA